ncbi:MAG: ABC transporter substrate-binding protein [Prolixibacteraceae bacterium]|nr:ABC transporter substrate-binding protein [Prolixibacteraceae bacterium]
MKGFFTLPRFHFQITLLFFLLGMVLGCAPKGASETETMDDSEILVGKSDTTQTLRDVTFLPYWVTTAQFAGYYVAEEKGFYEKYGIRMHIIPFTPFVTSHELIAERKADFAAIWLVNAIGLKAGGVDIVNIAQPSSRSSLMLITKKSSGIDSIQKMDGKRAGIWGGFELQPRALFKKYNINVEIVPIGSTNTLFLMDAVEITNASWFDEYHSIINSGYDPDELNTFFFADYGLNFLEDGIYCMRKTMEDDPDLCRNFIKATLEGWRYAFANMDEAVDIVVNRAKGENLPVNRVHQKWMLERYRDLYLPVGSTNFHNDLSEKDYNFAAGVLFENGQIAEIPDFGSFFQPLLIE